jgi:hypothetical protein
LGGWAAGPEASSAVGASEIMEQIGRLRKSGEVEMCEVGDDGRTGVFFFFHFQDNRVKLSIELT